MSQIPYTVNRKTVKNINLRVRSDGTVVVSAHPRVSLQRIDAFVQSKAEWIERARNAYAQIEPPVIQTYATGGTYYRLGQPLTIQLHQGKPEGVVRLQNTLCITVEDREDYGHKHQLVTQFERAQCQEIFAPIVAQYQIKLAPYGVKMPQVRLRAMTSRWGSCLCNKNTITLNTKLLAYPLPAIEYVVLHELCHFIHPNHAAEFYQFLAQFMPDWKVRRDLLKTKR